MGRARARWQPAMAGAMQVSPENTEIARLYAGLAWVRMEREILEKAMAYFARERE